VACSLGFRSFIEFYTGIKIPTNPAAILESTLGFKQAAFFQFDGAF
jgi:hypothetical protein